MKADAEEMKKPDITITMSWEEAKAIDRYLGPRSCTGPLYDLFYILDDIINARKLKSEHTS